nr:MalY/PatB family protein [uncultured Sellimonas sp.]
MNYDFDKPVNRRRTFSVKWDVKEQELPMWVADMDFETAPEIQDAVRRRAEHGAFGYTLIPDEWYEAIQEWWEKRHHFHLEKEWLIFCTGVVPAISSAVRKLTTPAEKVVLLTPVYNIFFNSVVNNGRYVLECPLSYDGEQYEIDFQALEEALADPQTTMLIFCNPHNPVGKIWSAETMKRVGDLCRKYHVVVVSDEIHCELTDPGKEYIPFASVSEACRDNSITCIAPTKTFNLAGLQTAAVIVPNPYLRHKIWRALNTDEAAEPNVFGMTAAIAAYQKGGPWLDALRSYLYENKQTARAFLETQLPKLHLVPSEATYLLWIDCKELTEHAKELGRFLREKTGLYLSEGSQYGKTGETFLRMNIACRRAVLEDGLERLKQGVEAYQKAFSR